MSTAAQLAQTTAEEYVARAEEAMDLRTRGRATVGQEPSTFAALAVTYATIAVSERLAELAGLVAILDDVTDSGRLNIGGVIVTREDRP